MILKIYDMNKNPLGFVRKISDLKIESDLDNADKNMSFSYLARTHDIKNEFYIRTATDEYVVKTVNQKDDGTQEITAVLNVEELEGTPVPTFYAKDQNLETAAELILEGTGWKAEIQESLSAKVRTLNMSGTDVYQVLKNLATAYFCEIWFDTIKKVVHYVEEIGEDRGAYFIRGLNLISLDVSSDSTGFYTQIHPVGKDNLTIESVNEGKKYLSDFSYSKKVKTYYWKDENYTDPTALKEDAEKKLKEMAEPAESYTASITDLAAQSTEYSMLEYHLGDRIALVDGENGIRKKRRIKKITEYPLEPEKNTCEISNATPTFEEIQKKIQDAAALVEDLTGNTGIVLGSRVEDFTVVKDGLTMIGGKVSDLEDWKVIASSLITKEGIINTVGEYYATHDDITEIDQRLATTETIATQTKDKFNWIVKSGTNSTDFTLTDRTAELIADRINLIGLVSFSGLNGDTQGRISGAEQTASNAVSAAENAGSMAGAASTAAAEATKIANATNEQIASWCAENDKTLIDGAKIYTKSVTALQINTDDLFSQNLTATNLHVTGNSTVDGNLIASGINAGNITAGTLSADRIDVNGIFAQDITASGTITGAVLKGASGQFTGTVDAETLYVKGKIQIYASSYRSAATILEETEGDDINQLILGSQSYGSIISKNHIAAPSISVNEDATIPILNITDRIEITQATPYIDFHWGNTDTDYTSRIIENDRNVLNINGARFTLGGAVQCTSLAADGGISAGNGRIDCINSGSNEAQVHARNDVRDVYLCASSSGRAGIYDSKHGWIIRNEPDCVTTYINTCMIKNGKITAAASSTSWLSGASPGGASYDSICTEAGALVPVWRCRSADGAWVGASYAYDPGFRIYYANNARLDKQSDNGTDARFTFGASGVFYATSIKETSDEQRKDIKSGITADYEDLFMALKPILFSWKENPDGIHMGFGAQSVFRQAEACGIKDFAAVHQGVGDEPWSIAYSEFVPLLVQMVQKLTKEVQKLKESR